MKKNIFILLISAGLLFCNYARAATILPGDLDKLQDDDQDYYEPQPPVRYEMKYGKKNVFQSDKDNNAEVNEPQDENNEKEDDEIEGVSLKNSSSEKSISYRCTQDVSDRSFCTDMNGKPLSGKIAEKLGSSQYLKIENYKKGYRDGLCTYYDEHGVLKERTYYKSGIKNGMSKLYYETNNIKVLANYKDGLLDGIIDIYTSKGKLFGRLRYKKGVLEKGMCYPNGKKENIKNDVIKNNPFNTIYSCGSSL